jgi:hypothetical protein
MAAQTTNVSGVAGLRIILSTATTQLFLTGAVDLQELALCIQQDATGGRLITSGNIPGIGTLDSVAGSDTIYFLIYDASTNSWSIQSVALASAAITTPQVVGSFVNAAAPFSDFTTAGVSLLSITPPAGSYQLNLSAVVTTTLSGNSVSAAGFTLGWTDANGAETSSTPNALSAITAGGSVSNIFNFTSTGAAAITLTGKATTGNPTAGAVSVSAVITRLA